MNISKKLLDWAEQSEQECRRVELSMVPITENCRLLDLGCGDGDFTSRVQTVVRATEVHGVEIAEEQVENARTRGIKVFSCNLNERFEFSSDHYDLIVASHIIEHLSNTDGFLREIYRVLRDRGQVLIATPNLASLANIFLLVFGKQPSIAEVSDEALVGTWSPRSMQVNRIGPSHRRIFTRRALCDLLVYHGFTIEAVRMTGFSPLPSQLARSLVGLLRPYATNIIVRARKTTTKNEAQPSGDSKT